MAIPRNLITLLLAALVATPVWGGDAQRGEQISKTRCAACHTFQEGGANRVGPNLWSVVANGPGQRRGFNYSPDYRRAVATGFAWDDANLDLYLEDPTVFLREVTGHGNARSRMTFKLPRESDRSDVIEYLKTLQ